MDHLFERLEVQLIDGADEADEERLRIKAHRVAQSRGTISTMPLRHSGGSNSGAK